MDQEFGVQDEILAVAEKCECQNMHDDGVAVLCFVCCGPVGIEKAREIVAERIKRRALESDAHG
ncbi:hypothetical protein GCM10011390_42120 [Aureimonas endophytica]|uniref:Uncharacterized protein n=1 Tax=Aureimonas endophytica TaxID=2027858 RepID=A0A917EC36_9HYPH|nr:hypothetical protein [Aureimonas endophytica]GGE18519.1 hypothetical protein GCM10011390_42120 [Aureimonas endophytica]